MDPGWLSNAYLVADKRGGTAVFVDSGPPMEHLLETARDWNVGHFFDVGRGGHGHIYPMEAGLVRPGMFLFAYDMHCSNFGAVGSPSVTAAWGLSVVAG